MYLPQCIGRHIMLSVTIARPALFGLLEIDEQSSATQLITYSVTVMTHVIALEAGQSSQGTSEPIKVLEPHDSGPGLDPRCW